MGAGFAFPASVSGCGCLLRGDLGVAGPADGSAVFFGVFAALGDAGDVVDLVGGVEAAGKLELAGVVVAGEDAAA